MSTKDSPVDGKAPVAEVEDDSLDADDTKKVMDDLQVKYEPAKNGDAVIEIALPNSGFAGLGKEELMKVAYQPFWVRLRWFLFILFWLSWLGMIGGAIGIVIITPKCTSRPDWQKYPIYQLFSRSFQDSTDEGTGVSAGIGDLTGIRQRLPYLIDLGVKTIGISPIFKSPMINVGYDVSDFMAVDESYGSMTDFDALIKDAKERGLSVILDFIPNHSSDQHEWFKNSLNKTSPYADYYIWQDGKDVNGMKQPPNNWKCQYATKMVRGKGSEEALDYDHGSEVDLDTPKKEETRNCGSAWEWNEKRGQFYYHQFAKSQPDLNLRNPLVVEEIRKALRFWLDKGVTGFRMDSVPYLFESQGLEDEPLSGIEGDGHDSLNHTYTFNQPEVYNFLHEVRLVLNEYESKDGVQRLMLTEGYVDVDKLMLYYKNGDKDIAEMPMNLGMIGTVGEGLTGTRLRQFVEAYLGKLPEFAWPNWVVGNHDQSRVASRVGQELVDGINMIAMLLPGTPVTYYGEEIGMMDNTHIPTDAHDPGHRDQYRTPMQWSNETNAGFSKSTPWVPVNSDFHTRNVQLQESEEESHLKVYRELVKLRQMASALYGGITYPLVTENVFSFVRNMTGNPSLLVAVNLGSNDETVNFAAAGLPEELSVKLKSVGFGDIGSPVDAKNVVLRSKGGVVFSF